MGTYGYEINDDGEIVGTMPDGTEGVFDSIDEYDDAFYDGVFNSNNMFEIELPEIA